MPGTTVRDALAHELIADGVVEVLWPNDVQFLLEGDGSTSGYGVTIQGASNAAFDEDVVDIVHFTAAGANAVQKQTTYVDSRYVRADTDNEAGTVGGATITIVLPHDRRVRGSFSA